MKHERQSSEDLLLLDSTIDKYFEILEEKLGPLRFKEPR
jgi:hypothetical protein